MTTFAYFEDTQQVHSPQVKSTAHCLQIYVENNAPP